MLRCPAVGCCRYRAMQMMQCREGLMYFALCWKQVSCAEVPRGWLLQVQGHADDAVQRGAHVLCTVLEAGVLC